MWSSFVKVHNGIEYFKVRISFFKAAHIIVQHQLCFFPFPRPQAARFHIAKLHNDFLKQLFLLAVLDVFIVVGYALIRAFLSCVVIRESLSEQLLIKLPQILLLVGYVIPDTLTVNIPRYKFSVVMLDNARVQAK